MPKKVSIEIKQSAYDANGKVRRTTHTFSSEEEARAWLDEVQPISDDHSSSVEDIRPIEETCAELGVSPETLFKHIRKSTRSGQD